MGEMGLDPTNLNKLLGSGKICYGLLAPGQVASGLREPDELQKISDKNIHD